jgi:hypothetical protein
MGKLDTLREMREAQFEKPPVTKVTPFTKPNRAAAPRLGELPMTAAERKRRQRHARQNQIT